LAALMRLNKRGNYTGVMEKLLDIFINQSYQFSLHTRNDLKGALGVIARAAGNADLTIRVSDLIISKPEP